MGANYNLNLNEMHYLIFIVVRPSKDRSVRYTERYTPCQHQDRKYKFSGMSRS
jgi:hypothetical protein